MEWSSNRATRIIALIEDQSRTHLLRTRLIAHLRSTYDIDRGNQMVQAYLTEREIFMDRIDYLDNVKDAILLMVQLTPEWSIKSITELHGGLFQVSLCHPSGDYDNTYIATNVCFPLTTAIITVRMMDIRRELNRLRHNGIEI